MLNLLSGEFYKLRKSKGFYACCIAMIVAVVFIYGMLFLADMIQQGQVENNTSVILTTEAAEGESIFDTLGIVDMLQQIVTGCGAIIPVIFSAIFVIGEYGSGAVKNLVGKGYSRGKVFLAKYLMCSVAAVIIVLAGAVVTLICGCIFIGTDGLNGTVAKNFIIYTLLETGLVVALNGIAVTIAQVSRNMGIGISAGICVVTFSSLISKGMDLILYSTHFRFSNYWMTDLMSMCPVSDFDGKIVLQIVIASIVWFCLAMGLGMVHFSKKDVK